MRLWIVILAIIGVCVTGITQVNKPIRNSVPATRALTIVVPTEGSHFIRTQNMAPLGFKDKRIIVNVPISAKQIIVDDEKSGNSAMVSVTAGDTLELHSTDFDRIHRVDVHVTWQNNPVKAALVSLQCGAYKQMMTITPTSNGVVSFEDVPSGKAKLNVSYGENLTETRDLPLSIDHPAGAVPVVAALSNAVDTLPAPAAAGAPAASTQAHGQNAAPPSPAPVKSSGGFSGFINFVLGVVIVGGMCYFAYRWAQSGGLAVALKKLGIEVTPPSLDPQIPGAAGPPPVMADPAICAFCGQKKDSAGNCACTVGSSAVFSGGAPVSGMPSQPRLIATGGVYSASIFTLNAASMRVGREQTCDIALPNDTTVSRHHATIKLEADGAIITDEGSANGVFVNGVKINGPTTLHSGDETQIGATRFRFEAK